MSSFKLVTHEFNIPVILPSVEEMGKAAADYGVHTKRVAFKRRE